MIVGLRDGAAVAIVTLAAQLVSRDDARVGLGIA